MGTSFARYGERPILAGVLAATVSLVSAPGVQAAIVDRDSTNCPGATETANIDDNTGILINLFRVYIPSGATATCFSNPGIPVEFDGSNGTLINNVVGLNVIGVGVGNGNSVVNNGNIPTVIMSGSDTTITNNVGATSSQLAIGGINGVVTNAGTVANGGSDSFAIGIQGFMSLVTNTGTAQITGSESAAIALEGANATINNAGTATLVFGNSGAALFIEGDDGTITNSGNASATGVGASAITVEGQRATITNFNDVAASGNLAFGMSVTGDDAILTNNDDITTSGGALAGMGIFGDDGIQINDGTVTTSGANGLGVGALGLGQTLTNAGGGTITTSGSDGHGMALGLEDLATIASGAPLPPGAVAPAQGQATNLGTITTSGVDANGMYTFANGATLTNRGTIVTQGKNGAALYGTGQNIALINGAADGSAPGATLNVNGGTRSRGIMLNGVDSRIENYANISVTGGVITSATSFLDFSHGIVVDTAGNSGSAPIVIGGVARPGSNNVIVNKGTISATTQAGRSILVATNGLTIENQSGGTLADGIVFNPGAEGVVNNAGTISGGITDVQQLFGTTGTGPQVWAEINNAAGGTISGPVSAISMYEANGFVTNDGTISIAGPNAAIAVFIGTGNSRVVNNGMITTNGTDAWAIGAYTAVNFGLPTQDQQPSLSADIRNFGTIMAGKGIGTQTNGTSSIVNGGTITTTAAGGDAVVALTLDPGGDIDAFNQGTITTSGNGAAGIEVAALQGTVRVENAGTGTITTAGANAFGITAISMLDDNPGSPGFVPALTVLNSGKVTTGGTGAHGIAVLAPLGTGRVTNSGTVTVASNTANAIFIDPAGFDGLTSEVINEATGVLNSAATAIQASDQDDKVTNKGTIIGDVQLGDGNDTYTVHDGSSLSGTVFSGPGSTDSLVADFAGTSVLNGGQYVSFDRLEKTGAGQLDFVGSMVVNDTLVDQGSVMMQAGANLVSDVTVAAGAAIGGSGGTITGNVTGAGTIAPGLSPGTLDIVGTVDWAGIIEVEIAGLGPLQFDVLNIVGDLNLLAAEIEFIFLDGFLPDAGDIIPFLNVAGGVTGFQNTALSFVGALPGFSFDIVLTSIDGGGFGVALETLAATGTVPQPSPIALVLIGLAGLVRRSVAGSSRRTAVASGWRTLFALVSPPRVIGNMNSFASPLV